MVLSNCLGTIFQDYLGSSVHIQPDENLEQHPQALVKVHSCTPRVAAAVACLHKWARCGAGSCPTGPPYATASPARPPRIPRDTFKRIPCYQIPPSANPSVPLVVTLIKRLKTPPCRQLSEQQTPDSQSWRCFLQTGWKGKVSKEKRFPADMCHLNVLVLVLTKAFVNISEGGRETNAHRI